MPKAQSPGQDVKPVLGRFLCVSVPPSPRSPAKPRPVVKRHGPVSACEPSGSVELRLPDGSTETVRIRGEQFDGLFKYINPVLGPSPERPPDRETRVARIRDLFLRIALFRMWNRIDTWEELESTVDPPLVWANVDFEALSDKLASLVDDGRSIYSSAYQNNGVRHVPGRTIKKGVTPMYQCHLWLIEAMLEDVPRQLEEAAGLENVYKALIKWSGIGGFIGYQLALDLNMLPYLDFDVRFAQPGPGAQKGLALLFGSVPRVHEAIALLVDRQDLYWERLGLEPPCMVDDDGKVVGKPGVSVVEVEHSLCELSKIDRFRKSGLYKREFTAEDSAQVTATHPARFRVKRE